MSFPKKLLSYRSDLLCNLPSRQRVRIFIDHVLGVLFPHFSDHKYESVEQVEEAFINIHSEIKNLLLPVASQINKAINVLADEIVANIPDIHNLLILDAEAMHSGDPAAKSVDEVIITYPGFYAVAIYRIAHAFYEHGIPIFPRIMTEYAHEKTGIDIHPGAKIGQSFCIDHGTGVVIGETTIIGNNVKIYQGVTLGGLSVDKFQASKKRHPTIEDNVIIYSNATILGGDTVIGKNSIIGGNVWIVDSVSADSKLYYNKKS